MHRELISDPLGPTEPPSMIRPRPAQREFLPIFGSAEVSSSPVSLGESQLPAPYQVRHLPPFALSTQRLSLLPIDQIKGHQRSA